MATRCRRWCVVVHQSSKCYDKIIDIVKAQNKCSYSMILHNNDIEKNDNGVEELKKSHWHIVLSYDNPRTFLSMSNTFEGAHIENCEFYNMSVQYLIHKNHPEKTQYSQADIITNYTELELSSLLCCDEYDKLTVESLFQYIQCGEIWNITSAIEKYGIRQVNVYRNLIKEVIDEKLKERQLISQYDTQQTRIQELLREIDTLNNSIENLEKENSILRISNQRLKEEVEELGKDLRLC